MNSGLFILAGRLLVPAQAQVQGDSYNASFCSRHGRRNGSPARPSNGFSASSVSLHQSLLELGILQLTVEMQAAIPLLRATFPCTNEKQGQTLN